MSLLATLNSPPLVSTVGIAAAAALPALENACIDGSISWSAVRSMIALSYGLNVFGTAQPGRIDGIQRQQMEQENAPEGEKEKKLSTESLEMLQLRDTSLVLPAGWAFAIWGPIFLGELIFSASTALITDEFSPLAMIIKKASGGFVMSQIYQTLWAASFRPKYKGLNGFVSAAFLSGIALSLSRAHAAYTTGLNDATFSTFDYLVRFLPITLHFGWTTAASLVNLNGSLSMMLAGTDQEYLMVWIGHATALIGTAVGVWVTVTREAPVYGGVLAWALTACSATMNKKIQQRKSETATPSKKQHHSLQSIATQKWLCAAGALACGAASVATALTPRGKVTAK